MRCDGIPFIGDTTWLAEGRSVAEVLMRLEKTGKLALVWAEGNGASFGVGKTEAILFTRNRRHWEDKEQALNSIDHHQFRYNHRVTRWLGIWLDYRLNFAKHTRRYAARACDAEKRLASIVTRHGVPPISARHLQQAITDSTMMYSVGGLKPVCRQTFCTTNKH